MGPTCSFTVPYCSVSDGPGPGRMESALSTLSPTKSSHFSQETWTKILPTTSPWGGELARGEDRKRMGRRRWDSWGAWKERWEFELHLNQKWRLGCLWLLPENLPRGIKRELLINKWELLSYLFFVLLFQNSAPSNLWPVTAWEPNKREGAGPSSLISMAAIPRSQGKHVLSFCSLCVSSRQRALDISIVKKNSLLVEEAKRMGHWISLCRLQREAISKS